MISIARGSFGVRKSKPSTGIWGVRIDLNNPDPDAAVTYTDDAKGMTPGSSDWDATPLYSDIRPCVLGILAQNGTVAYYLNPDNYYQKADGSPSNIVGGDGNVMVEIPKKGYSIQTAGNILSVKMTHESDREGFVYYGHTRQTPGDCSHLYIGAYSGSRASGRLISISGAQPVANRNLNTFRTEAQANGSGYDILSFFPLTLLQCLYLIRYKNRNSQKAVGRGYVDDSTSSSPINTGATNMKGMYYGNESGLVQVKVFGIEDLWGNITSAIDGALITSNYDLLTSFSGFNDTGNGYINSGAVATSDISGYMIVPHGNNEKGFISKQGLGISTQYFCDVASTLRASAYNIIGSFGGYCFAGDRAGMFSLDMYVLTAESGPIRGARLMYLSPTQGG